MISYEKFINGMVKYLDNEIIPQMTGVKKMAFGVGSSIFLKKGENVFNSIKDKEIIHSLELLDNNYNININMLKEEIIEKLNNENIEIDIPMIGTLTLDKNDIEKIYKYMKGE